MKSPLEKVIIGEGSIAFRLNVSGFRSLQRQLDSYFRQTEGCVVCEAVEGSRGLPGSRTSGGHHGACQIFLGLSAV